MIRRLTLAALLCASTTAIAAEPADKSAQVQQKIEQKLKAWLTTSAPESLTSRLAEASPERKEEVRMRKNRFQGLVREEAHPVPLVPLAPLVRKKLLKEELNDQFRQSYPQAQKKNKMC